uniref:Uncharacterized protein n=1 Tax=Romanomermis culicivorax TaxID=13658 RepID=A0A915JXP8_ROMCU
MLNEFMGYARAVTPLANVRAQPSSAIQADPVDIHGLANLTSDKVSCITDYIWLSCCICVCVGA